MEMVKKSISVTEQQDSWIKAQIRTGHFGNESEIIRELIRERQMREQETPAQIEAIRAALIEGEQSGQPRAFDFDEFVTRMRKQA